jgi:hypothetical protein
VAISTPAHPTVLCDRASVAQTNAVRLGMQTSGYLESNYMHSRPQHKRATAPKMHKVADLVNLTRKVVGADEEICMCDHDALVVH